VSKLYIVGTPIGNLKDITLRAIDTLRECDIIACEDTRKAKILLSHFNINKKLISYHKDNEERSAQAILKYLVEGNNIALISEAGTPNLSDPGYDIIQLAYKNDIEVVPIPGVSALTAAVSVANLPVDRFFFLGFLPMKQGKRKKILEKYKDIDAALVLYESPYKLLKTLNLIKEIYGNKQLFIARELTKIYEEKLTLTSDEAIKYFSEKKVRGEFVIIVNLKNFQGEL